MSASLPTKIRVKTKIMCRCGNDQFTIEGGADGYYAICTNEACKKKRYVIL